MRAISRIDARSMGTASPVPPRAASPGPHRRVMRAAWTLYRTCGGTFSEALKQAWRHEKAQAGLAAAKSLQDEIIDTAYLNGSILEIKSAFPIEDYLYHSNESRRFIARLIERLMSVLDAIDGDADMEPLLGSPESIGNNYQDTSQIYWSLSLDFDAELELHE